MSVGAFPKKPDDGNFAVVVDPGPWSGDLDSLAETVVRSLGRLDRTARRPDLVAALSAGPATVAHTLSRADAHRLVELLSAESVLAKLSRRQAEPPRPAPEQPSSEPDRPARPPTSQRRTLIDGWQLSLGSRDAPAVPSPDDHAPTEPAPPQERSQTPTILGWGDFIGRPKPPIEPDRSSEARGEPAAGSGDEIAMAAWPSLDAEGPAPTGDGDEPPRARAGDGGEVPAAPEEPPPATPPNERREATATWRPPPPIAFEVGSRLPGRPIPRDDLMPRPWLATLLSVLAPGAGQIYLGQRQQAHQLAMTAPFLVPWVRSIRDARRDAQRVRDGQRPARARPNLLHAIGFTLSVWGIVAAVAVGSVLLYTRLTQPTVLPDRLDLASDASGPSTTAPAAVEPQPIEGVAPALPAADDSARLRSELEERRRQQRARRLTVEAAAACESANFQQCADLSEQARALDPDLTEAARLFHRATVALEATGGSAEDTLGTDEDLRP